MKKEKNYKFENEIQKMKKSRKRIDSQGGPNRKRRKVERKIEVKKEDKEIKINIEKENLNQEAQIKIKREKQPKLTDLGGFVFEECRKIFEEEKQDNSNEKDKETEQEDKKTKTKSSTSIKKPKQMQVNFLRKVSNQNLSPQKITKKGKGVKKGFEVKEKPKKVNTIISMFEKLKGTKDYSDKEFFNLPKKDKGGRFLTENEQFLLLRKEPSTPIKSSPTVENGSQSDPKVNTPNGRTQIKNQVNEKTIPNPEKSPILPYLNPQLDKSFPTPTTLPLNPKRGRPGA